MITVFEHYSHPLEEPLLDPVFKVVLEVEIGSGVNLHVVFLTAKYQIDLQLSLCVGPLLRVKKEHNSGKRHGSSKEYKW